MNGERKMTEEELEKEVEDIVYGMGYDTYDSDGHSDFAVRDILIKSLEPREKQIQIDAEQIRALQKQNGELTDKVNDLEAQIEKMKCCYNCKHSRTDYVHCITDKHEKWEMIEK